MLLLSGAASLPDDQNVSLSGKADTGPAAHIEENTAPLVVTSDSPQYCRTLQQRVAHEMENFEVRNASVITAARHFEEDGTSLCEGGHVRPGIAQLRRALVALRQP